MVWIHKADLSNQSRVNIKSYSNAKIEFTFANSKRHFFLKRHTHLKRFSMIQMYLSENRIKKVFRCQI